MLTIDREFCENLVDDMRAIASSNSVSEYKRSRKTKIKEVSLFLEMYKDILPTWLAIGYNKKTKAFQCSMSINKNVKKCWYIGPLTSIASLGSKIEEIKKEASGFVAERLISNTALTKRFYVKKYGYKNNRYYAVMDYKFNKYGTSFCCDLYESSEEAYKKCNDLCNELNRLEEHTKDRTPSAFFIEDMKKSHPELFTQTK